MTIPLNEYSSNSFNYNFNSTLTPSYYFLKENDDRVLSMRIYGIASYNNQYNNYDYSDNTNDNYGKSWVFKSNINLNVNYKKYLDESDIFYSLGSTLNFSSEENRKEGNYTDNGMNYYNTKYQDYSLSIGVGWGRMRNVTPVVSAIRFQERLKQINIIDHDLNDKTIEDLAGQLSKEIYYSNVYDRSGKYFWDDIEKTLSQNGISLSGLNQYGSYYLKEIPSEIRFQRNEGLSAGLNFQFDYNNNYSSYSLNNISEQYYTLANIFLNYSHQINLNSQINLDISLKGGPNVNRHPYYRQEYFINTTIGYNYELTDRIVTSISNAFSLSFINRNGQSNYYAGGQEKYLSNDTKLSINYFIEDKISLNTSYELFYSNNKYPFNKGSQINNILSLGLTYYIDKGFLY